MLVSCDTNEQSTTDSQSREGLLSMIFQTSPELADTLRDDQALLGHHLLRPLGECGVLADVQVPRQDRSGQCLLHHPHPLCSL